MTMLVYIQCFVNGGATLKTETTSYEKNFLNMKALLLTVEAL